MTQFPTPELRFAKHVGFGIYVIDTGMIRPQSESCYVVLMRSPSQYHVAIIDSGTNNSVPRVMGTLEDLGCSPEQVDFIILTHVHLDHAGGAGWLMQLCPQAQLIVHPRGVRHIVDPSILMAGVVEVYGEAVAQAEYGQLIPIPIERIIAIEDDVMVDLCGRMLLCLDTPGHAKHHICIWDAMSSGIFTGDTFGLSYRELDTVAGEFIFPTTPPTQFDPKTLRITIKQLMALNPEALYLTHFGKVMDVPVLCERYLKMLTLVEELGQALKSSQNRFLQLKEGLLNLYTQELRDHGCQLSDSQISELLALDVDLNAQGMDIWLGQVSKSNG